MSYFVRHDGVRKPLQPPNDGPFKVTLRGTKTFDLDIRGSKQTISINILKLAFKTMDSEALEKLLYNEPVPVVEPLCNEKPALVVQPTACANNPYWMTCSATPELC